MSEKDLNIKYIQDKTGLVDNDELVPIILEMIQESYKSGLCQSEYDNTMGLIEENEELKKQLQIKENGFKASKDELCEYAIRNEKLEEQLSSITLELKEYKSQQQEFIKYLEDEIERKRLNATCMFEYNDTVLPLKKILQKYKEIIVNDKE